MAAVALALEQFGHFRNFADSRGELGGRAENVRHQRELSARALEALADLLCFATIKSAFEMNNMVQRC
jgi:hypothetical protein